MEKCCYHCESGVSALGNLSSQMLLRSLSDLIEVLAKELPGEREAPKVIHFQVAQHWRHLVYQI